MITMESDTLLHFANFSTLFACMVLKFPQIFLLLRAKTTTGVSFNSLLLELIGYVMFLGKGGRVGLGLGV